MRIHRTVIKAGDRWEAINRSLDPDLIWYFIVVGVIETAKGESFVVCVKEGCPDQAYSFDEDGHDLWQGFYLFRKMRPRVTEKIIVADK